MADRTQEEIAILQELLWREDARDSLAEFGRTMPIPGVPQSDNYEELYDQGEAPPDDDRYDNDLLIPQIETEVAAHHLLMYEKAQGIIEGTMKAPDGTVCRRMMAMCPPGSAKSTCFDVVTPSWAIGKFGHEIVLASCADMIAKKHGKRARQLCMSPEFRAVFETGINPKTKAADNWAMENGGSYLSAGIHGQLMGNRADGLLTDDVLRGKRASMSQTERDNAWESYQDNARTRKKPGAWEIMIGTRWHEDDVMGRILPANWKGESGFILCRDGNWWYVLCLQAQVEVPGDPLGRPIGAYLWEEWFNEGGDPEAYWRPLKLDPRSWSALYQQVPSPPEGDFFRAEWVHYYDALPANLNYFLSGDYAVTAKEENPDADFSSIGVWGVNDEGRIHFVTGVHYQTTADVWAGWVLDYNQLYKPLAHVAGKGPIRRATEPIFKTLMRQRKAFLNLVWLEESYSKEVNAQAFRAAMSCGMVSWPRNDPEAAWIIGHLLSFPTGPIDDPVDMCAMLGRHVASLWGPAKPKPPEPKPIIRPNTLKMDQYVKRRKRN